MKFCCQNQALKFLHNFAELDRHSILISGCSGSGKTYLAKQYSKFVGAQEFFSVPSTVSAIRDGIDSCYMRDSKTVMCVENLDKGVLGASYTILKFLEEPISKIYVVITCENVKGVPDTILSRSTEAPISGPTYSDITQYGESKNYEKFKNISSNLRSCLKSFKDVDLILNLSDQKLEYFHTFDGLRFKDPVSTIVWNIGHFPDNSETPIDIVIRYIMIYHKTLHEQRCSVQCLNDLNTGRIAKHAILSKYCMDMKYTE